MKMFAVIFACICIAGSKACTIVAVGKVGSLNQASLSFTSRSLSKSIVNQDAGGGSVYLAHTDDAGGGTQVQQTHPLSS